MRKITWITCAVLALGCFATSAEEKRPVPKEYDGIAESTPPKKIDWEKRTQFGNKGNVTVYVDKNGKEAKLKYKVIKKMDNLNLVDIELLSGRHHQIRVQFSSRNNPVLGDALYDEKYDGKLYLHAYSLSFNHPITKEKMEFIENPIGGKWDLFFKE